MADDVTTDELTDDQLRWILMHRLSSSNGWSCRRVLIENGLPKTQRVCVGRAVVENGRLLLRDTCGEPCSYVCDDAKNLAESLRMVRAYDEACRAARARKLETSDPLEIAAREHDERAGG